MAPVRSRPQPRHVVVLGASLAGSFAAAAAAAAGRTVTVLERDELPDAPRPRSGVPQGRQPHVFLYRGMLAVEELLPGFRDELHAAGAVEIDTGTLAWNSERGWQPTGRPQFAVLSATRPLFEDVVRRRVAALPGVTLRDGVRVTGLRRGDVGAGPAWWVDLADGTSVAADLVVDATGRSSRLPVWLAAAGVAPARVTEVDAHVGYSARVYALDPGSVAAPGIVIQASPDDPRGGIALPVEGGRWIVGGVGVGQRPPRDADALAAYLAGLRDGALAELHAAGRPEGDVAVHRQTGNRRHHYEDVRNWPAGLLVVGDAMCAFNPVYGQGVTVAACEALVLRDALRRGLRDGDERRLLRRFARVAALPWSIATGEDLRYASSDGRQPAVTALLGRWTRELGRLSVHGDELAHSTTMRVYHLMGSPWLLLRPGLVAAALRARVRGYGPAAGRPAIVHEGRAEHRAESADRAGDGLDPADTPAPRPTTA
ncbi:NAD(P)/FAD-dependent oxidoreductase [Cellulomonas sp. NS3]|uniref:NAD(P)/FAD-dependent oxidoreductase n=1 Tax=Cellulomonas sp. NS3 TaxID=2973977 RepID=UPI0021631802|nr:FAD-dependent monooxygenase [Cellulomonas sp. NS3]